MAHKKNKPVEYYNGDKEWFNKSGEYHRIDGPAREYTNGYKEWYLNGKRHRLDGPAVEFANGYKSWYLNGEKLSEELHTKLTVNDIEDLPLYLGLGFDGYISERLK